MTAWQVFEFIFWLLVLVLFVFVAASFSQKNRYNPNGIAMYWRKAWFRKLVGFVFINFELLTFLPTRNWWVDMYFNNFPYLVTFYVSMVVGAALVPENPKTERRIGYALMSIALVGVLYHAGALVTTTAWYDAKYGSKDLRLEAEKAEELKLDSEPIQFNWTRVKPAETFGFTYAKNSGAGINAANLNIARTYFTYQAGAQVIDPQEAAFLSLTCVNESSCNQWNDKDEVQVDPRSSARGLMADLLHEKFVAQLTAAHPEVKFDPNDPNGNLNLALALCLRAKSQGKPCSEPWKGTAPKTMALMQREGLSFGAEASAMAGGVPTQVSYPVNTPYSTPELQSCKPMQPITLKVGSMSDTIKVGKRASIANSSDVQWKIRTPDGVLHDTNLGRAWFYAIPEGITEFQVVVSAFGDSGADSSMFIITPCS